MRQRQRRHEVRSSPFGIKVGKHLVLSPCPCPPFLTALALSHVCLLPHSHPGFRSMLSSLLRVRPRSVSGGLKSWCSFLSGSGSVSVSGSCLIIIAPAAEAAAIKYAKQSSQPPAWEQKSQFLYLSKPIAPSSQLVTLHCQKVGGHQALTREGSFNSAGVLAA